MNYKRVYISVIHLKSKLTYNKYWGGGGIKGNLCHLQLNGRRYFYLSSVQLYVLVQSTLNSAGHFIRSPCTMDKMMQINVEIV